MKCKNCNAEMILDDVDRHSKGNCNKYWICEKCDTGCVEEIKDNVTTKITWQED